MDPVALVFVIASINIALTVFAAIVVPIIIVFMAGLVEFVTSWSTKGRSKYPLRIWTSEVGDEEWRWEPADVDRLVTLQEHKEIQHIEPTVRFSIASFSSLGLDLVMGAYAIDVASLIQNEGAPTYLGIAVIVQLVMLIAVVCCMQINQSTPPYQPVSGKLSALGAIFFGLVAMMSSFLALDESVVNEILASL